jgi:hypothetical protein
LTGFETLSVSVGFVVSLENTDETGPEDWNVEYSLPGDGPRAFVSCEKCRHEVKVSCRNERTGKEAILWPAEVYQLLWGILNIYGVGDDTFKGQVDLDRKKLAARLVAGHPQLGNGRHVDGS